MRRGIGALVVAAVAAVGVPPSGASVGEPVRLVVEVDGASSLAVKGATVVRRIPELGVAVVEVASGSVAATVATLRAQGASRVELDVPVAAAAVPNDRLWLQQWGPHRVRADEAWDRTMGSPSTVVAVLDTGITAGHPDFAGAMVAGVDLVNRDGDPADDHGHGTAVAGIVAARIDDGTGIAGYCGRCALDVVKVLDADGIGDSSVVAEGVVWAVDHGADVVNLSLSSPSSSFVLGKAVGYAAAHDVVVVAAAGNEGEVTPAYPAAYPGVVGVVATGPDDRVYRWSNRGSWASIAAPGCHRVPTPRDWDELCGTSSAAPAVAGIVALMRSVAPGAKALAITAALVRTAVPAVGVSVGRVSALDAVAAMAATSADVTGTRVPSAPRRLGVEVDRGAATVFWEPPADAGSSAITGYVVTVRPTGAVRRVPATERSLVIDGLGVGASYRFEVAAENGAGTGPPVVSSSVTPAPAGVSRVAGGSRVSTAVALSRRAFDSASAVVLARADDFADALAAGPLAAEVGGPILLTSGPHLDAGVRAEISRLSASTVHLVGGTTGLPRSLEGELRSIGVATVARIAGRDRFDTARLVAAKIGGPTVYVANGVSSWADAVAVSALAASQRRPILLVADDGVPGATRRALLDLDIQVAIAVGGTSSVSAASLDALADPDRDGSQDVVLNRIGGADRYDTSRRLADMAVRSGSDGSRAWLVSGASWSDALAAGPAVAARGGVMLLVRGEELARSGAALLWLTAPARAIDEVVLVGGTASISDLVADDVVRLLVR